MGKTKLIVLAILCFGALVGQAENSETDTSQVVANFVAAFNAHDPDAMSAMVTDNVRWLSVNGTSLTVELEGKAALAASMGEYFAACTTCRSEVRGVVASHERVSAVEVASWVGRDGLKSQQSLVVYEFSGSLIQSVYYFPEEAISPP